MKKRSNNAFLFHICVDCRFLDSSGLGRYIRNLIQLLVEEQDIYFTFITYSDFLGFFDKIKSNNYHLILAKSQMYSIHEQLEMPFKIPKCDAFWSPHYPIPILPIPAKKRITTIHDVNHLVLSKDLSPLQKLYAKWMFFCSTRVSHSILTVSQFSKNEIMKYTGIASTKIFVTHIGIDIEKFHPIHDLDQLNNIRIRYQLPNRFILYVGNVKPHKNIQGILKAFSIMKSKGYQEKLVIVGRKENFLNGINNLNSILDELKITNEVIFTGYMSDVDLPYIYNLAKVFVFPSFYEGFGLPPLEAMACGCPVIASNVASLPEVCGNAAEYVNPCDETDIARGIAKVIDDETYSQNLINKGREWVRMFNWENAAKDSLKILKGLNQ
jgi:glycosyltransferase involved in cell wall biosynthesis